MSAELIQPPSSQQAEVAVLSAILAGRPFDGIELKPEDFYFAQNRAVYQAATELASRRQPVDVITIADHLAATGALEDIGGMAVFEAYTIPATNIRAYADIVRDNAAARSLMALGMQMTSADAQNWRELGDEIVSTLLGQAHTTKRWDCDLAAALVDGLNVVERAVDRKGLVGIDTGFERLNKIFGGYHPSDLYVFGARPAMGKTAFLLNTAQGSRVPVAFVSAEMPRDQLALRMISAEGGIDATRLRNAELEENDWPKITKAMSSLKQQYIAIMDKPAPTIAEVANFARRSRRDHGVRALYVDYIQRLKAPDRSLPKHEQVGEVVMGLKELARELNIPVIALAQVNRNVEQRTNRRPSMGDLKDSGAIEQEADAVVLIYRDEVYDANTTERGIAEFIVDKNRHGRIGTTRLAWDGSHMRFRNLAMSHQRSMLDDGA